MASVYAAPTAQWLASSFGLQTMMLVFGIAFFVVVVGLAQLLRVPPAGYVPAAGAVAPKASEAISPVATVASQAESGPRQMLRTAQFYLLWLMFAAGAGAGLLVISKMSKIATDEAGVSLGFVLVVVLAIGNGGGRILAGFISDRIGRTRTMLLSFVLQAGLFILLSQCTTGSVLALPVVLGTGAALIGANYGANLAVFPAVTKDWFGLRNFGVNYGLVFTAWGIGGFLMSLIAGVVYDALHSFNLAYFLAAGLLIIAAGLTFVVKPPKSLDVV